MKVKGIPNSFDIFGHTVSIEYSNTLLSESECLGLSIFNENRILLATPCSTVARSVLLQTYYHELTHFIFYYLSESEHCFDEVLVDRIGQVLHQVIVSSK